MERLFTNQESFQKHPLTYSPPLQTAKDSNVPNLSPPIPSPSLTPPHSVTTPTTTTATTHSNVKYIDKCVADGGTTSLNKADIDSQPRASLETAAILDQSLIRRLPPRKRMQSLKKQFTKPNLSVPVLSSPPCLTMNLVTSATAPILQEQTSPLVPTTTTPLPPPPPMHSTTRTDINTANHNSNSNNTVSRSPSPIINIEDDSGDTTETDDEDDWRLHRKRSISESTLLGDDFGRPKHTIIIQQHQQHQQQQQQKEPLASASSAFSTGLTYSVNSKLPPKSIKSYQNPSSRQSLSDQQASIESPITTTTPSTLPPKKVSGKKTKAGTTKQHEESSMTTTNTKKYTTTITTATTTTPARRTKKADGSKSKSRKTTTLYCICQTPYDATRFMIACDQCDQWFHGECIGISEKDGEFIDLYFCGVCGKDTGKKTSWKLRCENPTCHKSARVGGGSSSTSLPKYCSHKCSHAAQRSRLDSKEMKRGQQQQQQQLLQQPEQQIQQCMGILRMIEQKQRFLEMTKRQAQNYDICGFDSRLVWDNHLWIKVQRVVETEKDGTVILLLQQDKSRTTTTTTTQQQKQTWTMDIHRRCQHRRNDCRQHQQWPKVLGLELKKERKDQLQAIKALEKEMDLADASAY